jgi:AraC-like DNA-binding protein
LSAKIIAPAHTIFRRQQVAGLFDRCQVLAGRFGELSSSALIAEMNGLVAQLPASLSRADQIIFSAVLGNLLARLVRVAGIDGRADVTRGFLNLADAGPTMDNWRVRWFCTTECCAAVLPMDITRNEYRTVDDRVTRMLGLVQTQYVDPRLTMRQVAQTVNLCPSHAARMLKQQTGCGFLTHLHRCRIVLARRLLDEARLSIKEIGAAVGYAYASQFSRHFKLECGETPLAFRTSRSRRLSA